MDGMRNQHAIDRIAMDFRHRVDRLPKIEWHLDNLGIQLRQNSIQRQIDPEPTTPVQIRKLKRSDRVNQYLLTSRRQRLSRHFTQSWAVADNPDQRLRINQYRQICACRARPRSHPS